jgi:dienelactone hydrolase
LPFGLKRFKIEKEGFRTLYFMRTDACTDSYIQRANPFHIKQEFNFDQEKSIPNNMVRVFPVKIYYYTDTPVYHDRFDDFLIDTYEVTNQEYMDFINKGGYQKKEYWKHPFIKDGRTLSWEEAMALFKDKTGRTGPATWEAGDYPAGQDNYPVSGVSWYEAAAYAEYAGKSLPTVYHWKYAAGIEASSDIVPLSNFSEQGPAAVGTYQGMGPYGTYDMAGNVREWCWNQEKPGEKRYILGGGWNDQITKFVLGETDQLPFDRSIANGFRCIQYLKTDSSTLNMQKPMESYFRNVLNEKPVSDQEFNIILRMYSYPKTALSAVVKKIQKQTKDWSVEKITFDAAYGNERVGAYLFLPKNGAPPYQTVVYYPGSSVIGMPPDGIFASYLVRCFDFILKSGRAVLHPVYKGTFERSYSPPTIMWDLGYFQRDYTIMCAKDLRRSIDYLETRPDIDTSKLAYYGRSWGAGLGGIMLGVEKRLKTGILYVGGIWIYGPPLLPEAELLNFLPRVTEPVLMLNGRYDTANPYETSQVPLYQLLGTPAEKKKHFVYNTSHFVPRDQLIKETLAWLDQYLGPVR